MTTHLLHRSADVHVVLEELGGERLVDLVLFGQFQRNPHEGQAEHSHPAGGIGLFELGAARHLLASIDDRDVVETEKPPFEDVVPLAIDLVHPPGEVHQQLVKAALEEVTVGFSRADAVHVVDAPNGPSVHRRVQVGEFPFVRRNLPARVEELLEQQQRELLLGEPRIDQRERHRVKSEIPCGEPRVLPLVGHRHHPHRVQIPPVNIAVPAMGFGWRPVRIVAVHPDVDVVKVNLLAPNHPRECLALDAALVFGRLRRMDRRVELVRLRASRGDDSIDVRERVGELTVGEAEPDDDRPSGRDVHGRVVEARLGSDIRSVDAVLSVNDVAMERILHPRTAAVCRSAEDTLGVGFVVREQRLCPRLGVENPPTQAVLEGQVRDRRRSRVVGEQARVPRSGRPQADRWFRPRLRAPRPRIAEPQVWQHM